MNKELLSLDKEELLLENALLKRTIAHLQESLADVYTENAILKAVCEQYEGLFEEEGTANVSVKSTKDTINSTTMEDTLTDKVPKDLSDLSQKSDDDIGMLLNQFLGFNSLSL